MRRRSTDAAERRLQESEERFRSIFDNIGIGIAVIGRGMEVLDLNPQMRAWFPRIAQGPQAICFRSFNTPPREGPCDCCPTVHTLRDGKVHTAITETPTPEGIRNYRVVATPLRGADGSITSAIEMVEDVTDRIRAEAALQAREHQLAESQRIARIGSWEHNIRTGAVLWSDELFRLLGLDPQRDPADFELFFRRVHPHDQPMLKAAIERTLREQCPFSVEYRLVFPDGSIRVISARAELVPDETGAPVVLSGTAQDFTGRKEVEERIRRSEQFVRSILDTVDEGFIVVGRDYRIRMANRAYCLQVGRPPEEVVGRTCHEVSHHALQPCHERGESCVVREVLATGEPRTEIHRHADGEGGQIFVETRGFPVIEASGEVDSVIQTVTNITEKHLLEEERLKSQKLESIGTLAGGIAHDFNNLLQGVFGFISVAKLFAHDRERSVAALGEAEKALGYAVKLTNQLLTFSKGGNPVKKPTDLRQVIEGAARFALSGSRSTFTIEGPGEPWLAEADDGQIAQVVQNIVLNADQAMASGGTVRITMREVSAPAADAPHQLAPGRYLEVAVADSGAGIPERQLQRIFDPYFTTKESGSGLGLATSYSIVRGHGGAIEVQSELGRGTTFLLYLPAAAHVPEAPPAAAAVAPCRGCHILLMDDEDLIRAVTGELLGALGHKVGFARDGAEALALHRKARDAGTPFDVVILDLTIRGGMGGLETLRRIREEEPGVRAVLSSGYSDEGASFEGLGSGPLVFLKKPFTVDRLQEALNEIRRQASRSGAGCD